MGDIAERRRRSLTVQSVVSRRRSQRLILTSNSVLALTLPLPPLASPSGEEEDSEADTDTDTTLRERSVTLRNVTESVTLLSFDLIFLIRSLEATASGESERESLYLKWFRTIHPPSVFLILRPSCSVERLHGSGASSFDTAAWHSSRLNLAKAAKPGRAADTKPSLSFMASMVIHKIRVSLSSDHIEEATISELKRVHPLISHQP